MTITGRDGQSGAVSADYVAVLVLTGALVAGLLVVGFPRLVGSWAAYATCNLFTSGEQPCVAPGTATGDGAGEAGAHPGSGGSRTPVGPPAVPPRVTPLTDLLATFPPGPLSADEYRELAFEYVRGMLPEGDPENIYARNRAVTRAYAELYFLDPETYKWAGMAAFASDLVGQGIRQAEAARQHGGPPIPGVTDISFTELSRALQYGNALVYTDIFWQHLAYAHGGMAAIQRAYDDGDLHEVPFDGWAQIDRGRRSGEPDQVWSGNQALLLYEQQVTLQEGVYDEARRIFQRLSAGPIGRIQPMSSPIPGDDVSFQSHVPGGDIGDFDDRWAWISESMLPAWRRWEPDLTDELWEFTR